MQTLKSDVKDFWEQGSCGEDLYLQGSSIKEAFINQAQQRYTLEPEILSFGDFVNAKDKKVLEIGVGLGSDHQLFAEAGAILTGIDLTQRAIDNTKKRFEVFGLRSELKVADAECLPFQQDTFDIVYSWGVIHHSPNTPQIVKEIHRVLHPGGSAKIMIYHRKSIVGYMLWLRYGLGKLKPFRSLDDIYSKFLESPGTKAYSIGQAHRMFSMFQGVEITTTLTHADLLNSNVGQRHRGIILTVARKFFPRAIIKRLLPQHGLFMLITARK